MGHAATTRSLVTMSETEPPKSRTSGLRPFPKGKSGNPSGRPKQPPGYRESIEALAKKGLDALEQILDTPRHPRREQAAEYVCNRAWGTPTTRSEISGPDGGPVGIAAVRSMTTGEQRKRLAVLLAKAQAAASSQPPGEPREDPPDEADEDRGDDGPGDDI